MIAPFFRMLIVLDMCVSRACLGKPSYRVSHEEEKRAENDRFLPNRSRRTPPPCSGTAQDVWTSRARMASTIPTPSPAATAAHQDWWRCRPPSTRSLFTALLLFLLLLLPRRRRRRRRQLVQSQWRSSAGISSAAALARWGWHGVLIHFL
jgi:hypothetical protein